MPQHVALLLPLLPRWRLAVQHKQHLGMQLQQGPHQGLQYQTPQEAHKIQSPDGKNSNMVVTGRGFKDGGREYMGIDDAASY